MKIIRKTLAATLSLVGLLLFTFATSISASACVCESSGLSIDEAKEKATAVFLGKVTRTIERGDQPHHIFEVQKLWKGSVGKDAVVSIRTLNNCAYDFLIGETYLVYASGNLELGYLTANRCDGTEPVATSEDDMLLLGKPTHEFSGPPTGVMRMFSGTSPSATSSKP